MNNSNRSATKLHGVARVKPSPDTSGRHYCIPPTLVSNCRENLIMWSVMLNVETGRELSGPAKGRPYAGAKIDDPGLGDCVSPTQQQKLQLDRVAGPRCLSAASNASSLIFTAHLFRTGFSAGGPFFFPTPSLPALPCSKHGPSLSLLQQCPLFLSTRDRVS